VNLKKDAADYGADGMACHRDDCLILSLPSQITTIRSAKKQNKLKFTP